MRLKADISGDGGDCRDALPTLPPTIPMDQNHGFKPLKKWRLAWSDW
jgi:hypothetical protein